MNQGEQDDIGTVNRTLECVELEDERMAGPEVPTITLNNPEEANLTAEKMDTQTRK